MSPTKAKEHNGILITLEPRLVGVETAAKLCGISAKYWRTLDGMGKVPLPIQFGGRRRLWSVDELDNWIRAGCPIREVWQKEKT